LPAQFYGWQNAVGLLNELLKNGKKTQVAFE
jgi:hypothetical protein